MVSVRSAAFDQQQGSSHEFVSGMKKAVVCTQIDQQKSFLKSILDAIGASIVFPDVIHLVTNNSIYNSNDNEYPQTNHPERLRVCCWMEISGVCVEEHHRKLFPNVQVRISKFCSPPCPLAVRCGPDLPANRMLVLQNLWTVFMDILPTKSTI